MFKNRFKIILVVLFAFFMLQTFIVLKADSNKIEYYFDNELQDKDVYYDPSTEVYPVFEGYIFKHKNILNDKIQLFYETKTYEIVFDGNGGLLNGLEKVVYKTIKHGETYRHNPLIFKDYLFVREGYTLKGFERSFDREIVVTDNIVYKAEWELEKFYYTFKIKDYEYVVEQKYMNYIEFPSFVTDDIFIGWYNKENEKYEKNKLIDNFSNLQIFAKFITDIKIEELNTDNVKVSKFEGVEYQLSTNNNVIYDWSNKTSFDNLISNTTYKLKVKSEDFGEITMFEFMTKSNTNINVIRTKNEIILPVISNNKWVMINNNEELIDGRLENDSYIFEGLLENTEYSFYLIDDNDVKTRYEYKTKKSTTEDSLKHFVYTANGLEYLLLKKGYIYYLNNEIQKVNDFRILYNPNYKFKKLETDLEIESDLLMISDYLIDAYEDDYPITYTTNSITINNEQELKSFFVSNGEYKESNEKTIIYNDLDNNLIYYIIFLIDDIYYLTEVKLLKYDISIEIYSNKIIIDNRNGYKIVFKNVLYSSHKITIDNLESNKLYNMELELNGIRQKYYFYTNNNHDDYSKIDFGLIAEYDSIIISRPLLGYKYGILTKGDHTENRKDYDVVSGIVQFNSLKPGNEYEISIISSSGVFILDTIKTDKVPSEKVMLPLPIAKISSILETKIIIENDKLLEYSIDGINWIKDDNESLYFDGLKPYKEYNIYIRKRETNTEYHSLMVLANKVTTVAKTPSIDTFNNLFYNHEEIRFELLDGYDYYVNNIKVSNQVYSSGLLEKNSTHNLKVIRKSDGYEFFVDIKLKRSLTHDDKDKVIAYQKNDKELIILNSSKELTYIIKNNSGIEVIRVKGNSSSLTILVDANINYKIYIQREATNELYYEEELLIEVYIPYSLRNKLNDYLINIKKRTNKKADEIISTYEQKSFLVFNQYEIDLLVEEAKVEINKVYKNRNTLVWIVSSSILIVVGLGIGLSIYTKRKNRQVV